MALIETLTKLRLDNFMKEFDIETNYFNYTNRKANWELLKEKFIKHGYVNNNSDIYDCYCVIKNIVWKNIAVYSLVYKKLHVHMCNNNKQYISRMYCFFDLRYITQQKML